MRRLHLGSITALALLLLFVLSTPLFSQSNTTSLSGIVTDFSGAILPGAKVSLTSPDSGALQTATTQSRGQYTFEQIPPGKYVLRVSFTGFSEQVENLELLVATPVKLDVKLTVGTSEIVEVQTSSLASIDSTDGALGKAFNSQQVQNLPYLANNINYLLSLQPGVLALDSGATTGGLNTDTRTGVVNGARQDQSNITLDGVDNNDQTNGYAFNGALRATRESVEEFRVTTTNANADAGRSSGAQVSLVTRSGTNEFHGSAYEYYRDPGVSSNNWFNKQAQLNSGLSNTPLKILEHTYGASFGAPIKKNKLFFFGAYEGFKQASDAQVSETVPSILGGGGLITGNVVYAVCPTSAACLDSNTYKTLTPSDIAQMDPNCTANGTCPAGPGTNAAAIAYMKTFPLANSNVGGDGYNTGTYSFASPQPIHQITNIARLDYNLTAKQSVFVRGNLQSDNQESALQFPGLPAAANTFSNNKGIAAGHIWNISNALINNFRYGFIRQNAAVRGTGSQPYVDFSAFNTITATTTSTVNAVTTNNFADDFTYVKGRHTLQFGVNDRLVMNGQYFDSPLLSYASISPNLLATAAIAGKGTSLDPGVFSCPNCGTVADNFRTFYNSAIIANAGIIEAAQSGTEYLVKNNTLVPAGAGVVPTHTFKNLEQEYYFQDQWKANSRLTLTLGLRYSYLGVPYEKNGQEIAPTIPLSTFLQNRIAAANAGNAYTDRVSFAAAGSANGAPNFWTPQKTNFAPRFAFAYASADSRTSVRGGFAIAYDHFGEGVIDNYQADPSSLLSLSKTNLFTYTGVDVNPRFTGYHDVPLGTVTSDTLPLPYTPADIPFSFDSSISNNLKTPYAETFNLSVQREVTHGMILTASYVGRLGRHVLSNLDVAQPTNIYDPGSAQSYFAAVTAFDKMIDSGVSASSVPDSGYFHNLFPNFTFGNYKGAQAFYASIQNGDRGNETDTLFNADTNSAASPGGQSFRFFYPQTSSIYAQSTIASSNYNALQLSVRHALRYGMEYDANYTYSKSMDQGSSPERCSGGTLCSSGNYIVNAFDPSGQYAPSDFDVRHNITANYTAPLPFGRNMPFFNHGNGFLERIFGGFQLNGVVHYSSGFPFSATANGNWGTNFAVSSRFVQTGPIPTGGHRYVASGQYETALKGITAAQAYANLRYAYPGESGQRNNFRNDGYLSLDDGLSKSFRTFREQQFKISAEVFNVTNTSRFNALNTNGASSHFGQYTGGSATATGLLVQPRQMQFSGKYTF